jgi:hypothetical protein
LVLSADDVAAIDIVAPPEKIFGRYRDVEKWGETFLATIDHAELIKTGENPQVGQYGSCDEWVESCQSCYYFGFIFMRQRRTIASRKK